MYDADAYAPCRYHLIQRAKGQTALSAPTATNGSSTTAAAATSRPLPGTASRWRMPADVSGLDRHALMLRRVDDMYQATLYYFLQVWGVRGDAPSTGQDYLHVPGLCIVSLSPGVCGGEVWLVRGGIGPPLAKHSYLQSEHRVCLLVL